MSWFPRPRNSASQGFTTDSKEGRSCVLHDDVVYLFGGYSPCTQQANFEAFSLATRQMSAVKAHNREPWLRAHHSCSLFEDYLVIFGGEAYSGSADNKMLTSEVLIYAIKKNEFLRVPTNQPVEARKHHAAAIIGSHLVISGGIDEDLRVLGLLQTFHLKTFHWKRAPIACELPARANHSLTEVYEAPPKTLITAAPKNRLSLEVSKVLLEGLYMFGGVDATGRCTNSLTIINTSSEPWSLFDVHTVGQPPSPRADHSAHYLQPQCALVVYGGRNPALFGDSGRSVTGSIHYLDLVHLAWCQVVLQKSASIERYGFCSFAIGTPSSPESKIYVFGGIGEENFLETALDVLETDERFVHIAVRQNEKQMAQIASEMLGFAKKNLKLASSENLPSLNFPVANKRNLRGELSEPSSLQQTKDLKPPSPSKELVHHSNNFLSYSPIPDQFIERTVLRKLNSRLF